MNYYCSNNKDFMYNKDTSFFWGWVNIDNLNFLKNMKFIHKKFKDVYDIEQLNNFSSINTIPIIYDLSTMTNLFVQLFELDNYPKTFHKTHNSKWHPWPFTFFLCNHIYSDISTFLIEDKNIKDKIFIDLYTQFLEYKHLRLLIINMNNNYTNNTNIPNIIILEIEQFKELLFYIIKTFSCKYNIKQHICNKYIKYITKMYDINIIDNMNFTINKNNDQYLEFFHMVKKNYNIIQSDNNIINVMTSTIQHIDETNYLYKVLIKNTLDQIENNSKINEFRKNFAQTNLNNLIDSNSYNDNKQKFNNRNFISNLFYWNKSDVNLIYYNTSNTTSINHISEYIINLLSLYK